VTETPERDEGAPVIRDKRRIDPDTYEVREGAAQPAAPDVPLESDLDAPDALSDAELALAERTADLQRVQAEYTNYRRRVERDRQAVGEQALATVFAGVLPVLDDIDRARAHDEVTGGFAIEATLAKLGLERFGDAGEPFDPTVHEALTHGYSAEVTEPVAAQIFQSGYRVGERVLRPARVAVLEPAAEPAPESHQEPAAEPEPESN
jgi:molecular chaperone GrpE